MSLGPPRPASLATTGKLAVAQVVPSPDGSLAVVVARGLASVRIKITPLSSGERALVTTRHGGLTYTDVAGLSGAEAAEVVRAFARALDQEAMQRITRSWPHLQLDERAPGPGARRLEAKDVAAWLGVSEGATLDGWRVVAVQALPERIAVELTLTHAGLQPAVITIGADPGSPFVRIGPWALAATPAAGGPAPDPTVLHFCSRFATVVAERLHADPAVPVELGALAPQTLHHPVLGLLGELGLEAEAARVERGVLHLRVAGTGALRVEPRAGRISSYRVGRRLAVVPEGLPTRERAARLESMATLLLRAEDRLASALGHPEPEDAPMGRLFPAHMQLDAGVASAHERTGVLMLSSPCMADCVFCGQETTQGFTFEPVESVLADIAHHAGAYDRVLILGFEPLTHPGVTAMVAACRAQGVREIELLTSGVALAQPGMVAALAAAGLTRVAVPLYSTEAGQNDLVMRRAGAWALSVAALDEAAGLGLEVFAHGLLLRGMLEDIDALAALVEQRWHGRFVAAAPRSKASYAALAPDYAALARAVTRASVIGVPLCLVPRMLEHPDVRPDRPLQLTLGDLAESTRAYFAQGLAHEPGCADCAARHVCTGVLPEQRALQPELRLVPLGRLPSPSLAPRP